jgi:hypothetical protein
MSPVDGRAPNPATVSGFQLNPDTKKAPWRSALSGLSWLAGQELTNRAGGLSHASLRDGGSDFGHSVGISLFRKTTLTTPTDIDFDLKISCQGNLGQDGPTVTTLTLGSAMRLHVVAFDRVVLSWRTYEIKRGLGVLDTKTIGSTLHDPHATCAFSRVYGRVRDYKATRIRAEPISTHALRGVPRRSWGWSPRGRQRDRHFGRVVRAAVKDATVLHGSFFDRSGRQIASEQLVSSFEGGLHA